jgi:hypothetical protein
MDKACNCLGCEVKKRAPAIYDSIQAFITPSIEEDKNIKEWHIADILRTLRYSYAIHFVIVHAKFTNGKTGFLKSIIRESPKQHTLSFVDYINVMKVKDEQETARHH